MVKALVIGFTFWVVAGGPELLDPKGDFGGKSFFKNEARTQILEKSNN